VLPQGVQAWGSGTEAHRAHRSFTAPSVCPTC